jgi:hypothetical protein
LLDGGNVLVDESMDLVRQSAHVDWPVAPERVTWSISVSATSTQELGRATGQRATFECGKECHG